jgi:hypothetical protein
MKKRHLHQRFLVPNGRRGRPIPQDEGEEAFGYDTQPQRPLMGTLHHVDSEETIKRIAEATSMCDEPECDSEALADYVALNNRFNTLRHAKEVQQAQQERKTLTHEQRLASAKARAKTQRVNVTMQLHMVEKALIRAQKGGRHLSEGAVTRLEAVEALLDGPVDWKLLDAA